MPVQVLSAGASARALVALCAVTLAVGALAEAEKDLGARIFEHAGRLGREGRPELAVDEYRRLIEGYPDSSLADDALLAIGEHLYKVRSLDELGRARGPAIEEAFRIFERVRRKHARDNAAPAAIVRMAFIRLEPHGGKRDVDIAHVLFRSVSEIYPGSEWEDDARLGMAYCSRLSGRPSRVVVDLQPFWERLAGSPLSARATLWRADAFVSLGRRDRAFELYQRLREESPGSTEAGQANARTVLLLRRALAAAGSARLREDASFAGQLGRAKEISGVWTSPKGWIYLADRGAGRIVRFDRRGRRLGDRLAAEPALLAFDSYGQAAVLERAALRVGKQRWALAVPHGDKNSKLRPAAAPLPRNDASWWFVDDRGEAVLEFDRELKFQRVVWKDDRLSASRARPGPGGVVWLLDTKAGRLVRLNRDGEALQIELGKEPPALSRPVDLAVDPNGAVWVLDAHRKGLGVFSPVGEYEGFVPLEGAVSRSDLEAVEVDASGAVLVYDARQQRLRRFFDPTPDMEGVKRAGVKP